MAPAPPLRVQPFSRPEPHLFACVVHCPLGQVRGSIPLLWSQTPCLKYKIPIRIAPPSRNESVFAAHAVALADGYKVCRAVLCFGWRAAILCFLLPG